jgi:hypothetical protein
MTEIEIRRLEWLGHVVKMEDTCVLKMILNNKQEGRRRVGRPTLRWLYDVEADTENLKFKYMETKRSREKRMDGNYKAG